MGKVGGAMAPGPGITGLDLTAAFPRGVWGKRFKFWTYMWSNQESILTGPSQVHLGILPPEMRAYRITKAGYGVRKSAAHMKGRVLCNKTTRVKRSRSHDIA